MPRKPRLEYENAFYHVMNRGRRREMIFHDDIDCQTFINILKDVHERFDCVIHCYCLMGNHYHLLFETPSANFSRIMRHINGVYTQAYNRLKKTDGSLFRGRFKSILVDKDAYIMQLSRYIHRNPIDMQKPLIAKLEEPIRQMKLKDCKQIKIWILNENSSHLKSTIYLGGHSFINFQETLVHNTRVKTRIIYYKTKKQENRNKQT